MQTTPGNIIVGDSGRFGGYTPRTAAFLAATQITNTTIATALNNMDKKIILNQLESDLKFLHPFVGGTANTCKYNFMNVNTFMCTFYGGGTFTQNGYIGNGVNSYAEFGYILAVENSISSAHIATYDRTNNVSLGRYTIGARDTSVAWISYHTDTQWGYLGSTAGIGSLGSTNISRLRIATRTATNLVKGFRDGVFVAQNVTTIQNMPNVPLRYFNVQGLNFYSDHNLALGCGGLGLSDSKAIILNNIVNEFQTELGRNV